MTPTPAAYRILGVDPGTNVLGHAVVEVKGQKLRLVDIGVLRLPAAEDAAGKLRLIFERLQQVIDAHQPREMAIEAPFFGKNVQSMLKLGRAQGVAIAAAITKNLQVIEYAPRKIKQSITGRGNASKEQVAAMLRQILALPKLDEPLDATDALAAAVCHFFQSRNPLSGGGGGSGWASFARDNPGRIKG
jgi:crossover junction endodeoxyribonuclease RuvC